MRFKIHLKLLQVLQSRKMNHQRKLWLEEAGRTSTLLDEGYSICYVVSVLGRSFSNNVFFYFLLIKNGTYFILPEVEH